MALSTTVTTQGLDDGDIIFYEAPNGHSRITYPVAQSTTIARGELIELNTGNAIPLATAGNVVGVALHAVSTGSGETSELQALALGPAGLKFGALDYNSQTRSTVDAALLARGIRVHDEPTDFTQTT